MHRRPGTLRVKNQKLFEQINEILDKGGLINGGFVRDFLIRGEPFKDIDFVFFGLERHPFPDWENYSNFGLEHNVKKKTVDGYELNVMNNPQPFYNEISCNRFSFDGSRLYLKKSTIDFCPMKCFEMILKKELTKFHDPNHQYMVAMNLKKFYALRSRGWKWDKMAREVNKPVEQHDPYGPWSDFKLAKERYDQFFS